MNTQLKSGDLRAYTHGWQPQLTPVLRSGRLTPTSAPPPPQRWQLTGSSAGPRRTPTLAGERACYLFTFLSARLIGPAHSPSHPLSFSSLRYLLANWLAVNFFCRKIVSNVHVQQLVRARKETQRNQTSGTPSRAGSRFNTDRPDVTHSVSLA